jgi:segregation and condensation protein A
VLPDGSPVAAYLPPITQDVPARTLRCRAATAITLIADLERTCDGAPVPDQEADWVPIRVTHRAKDDPVADAFTRLSDRSVLCGA